MARALRIAYSGALYHLTSRGNERRPIYFDDTDRHHFLRLLALTIERFDWICSAFCLMENHFHLLVETIHANVSQGMQWLNACYTQHFNWRHKRVGHLFQGRFKGILVEKEAYFLELCRYIVLNPVRADMLPEAEDYRWSSYRATAGLEAVPSFLTLQPVWNRFGRTLEYAIPSYIRFVQEGKKARSPWEQLKSEIYLGSDEFIKQLPGPVSPKPGILMNQQKFWRPPLIEIVSGVDDAENALKLGYSQMEIADFLGVNQSTLSRRLHGV